MPRDTGLFKIKEQVLVAYTDKHYEAKVRLVLASMKVVLSRSLRFLKSAAMFCGAHVGDESRKKRGAVVLFHTLYCKSICTFLQIWIRACL